MNPIRERLEYAALSIYAWKMRWLPLRMSRWWANLLGLFVAKVLKIRREVALDNMRHAFPDKSDRELQQLYVRCWQHFMRVGVEMARIPRIDLKFIKRWIDLKFQDSVLEKMKQGKGIIVVSGHIGNWELIGAGMAKLGYPVTFVVTTQSNKLVEQWMDRMRHSGGIDVVQKKDAVRGVLSVLKRNHAAAIMCDQDAGQAGVFVPFFGREASTARGAALFHLKTGAPIIFGAAPCDDSGVYRILFEPLEFPDLTGDREHDIEIIMRRISERLEQEIRKHPEQWLWLHRRWKSVRGREG